VERSCSNGIESTCPAAARHVGRARDALHRPVAALHQDSGRVAATRASGRVVASNHVTASTASSAATTASRSSSG
jgi:hypothetical protein